MLSISLCNIYAFVNDKLPCSNNAINSFIIICNISIKVREVWGASAVQNCFQPFSHNFLSLHKLWKWENNQFKKVNLQKMVFHLHFGIKTRKHSFSKSESPKNIFTTPRIVSFPHSKQSITPVIYNYL